MAKDYYISRDAYNLEDLAAKKYSFFAENAKFQQMMNQFPQ